MQGVEVEEGFGGGGGGTAKQGSFKRSFSLRKKGSSKRLLDEQADEINLDNYGEESDSSEDPLSETEMYGGIADAHEIQCDVAVDVQGSVYLQHKDTWKRLKVCEVTPQKALNVLAVSQMECRQILVGSHHRPPREGLRVRIAKNRNDDLDDYLRELGKGKSGSVVVVAHDKKTVQVRWDVNNELGWYATGKVRKYGELGLKFSRLSAQRLEVREIHLGAENADGERFADTKEIIIGDQVTAINGTPVSKMSGDITHHLRTAIDLGPIDSIVALTCIDHDGGVFTVEVRRKVFQHTYDDEAEFEHQEMHPQGMYHLEVAEAKEGSSWHDTSWHDFKENGVLIGHAKVEFFHRSNAHAAFNMLGVDLHNDLNRHPLQPEEYQDSISSNDHWIRAVVGKRIVVESQANEDAAELFFALSETAGTVKKTHGVLKSKSTNEQVQDALAKMLDGEDDFAQYTAEDADRRRERRQILQEADDLQKSDVFEERMEGSRLMLQLGRTDVELRQVWGLDSEFTIDAILETLGLADRTNTKKSMTGTAASEKSEKQRKLAEEDAVKRDLSLVVPFEVVRNGKTIPGETLDKIMCKKSHKLQRDIIADIRKGKKFDRYQVTK